MTSLVIAPHADDEVLGMGGTIARFVREGKDVHIAVMTGEGPRPHPLWGPEAWDVVRSEARKAASILGVTNLDFFELPAMCLDSVRSIDVNSEISRVINAVRPDEVFIPFHGDLHKDHGAISYGAIVALRPYFEKVHFIKRLLAYETLSQTHLAPQGLGDSFRPNVYIDISETLDLKLEAMSVYSSQLQTDSMPRSTRVLSALAALRGAHIGTKAAEAFVLLGEYRR